MSSNELILIQPKSAWGLPSISPFSVKLEFFLKIHKIPYQIKNKGLSHAPKGKIPFVFVDGKYMGDTGLIQEYLIQSRNLGTDDWMSSKQKALNRCLIRMWEETIYFELAYLRWKNPEAESYLKEYFNSLAPFPVSMAIYPKIRKNMLTIARMQGVARHSMEEILAMLHKDLESVEDLLEATPYVLGEKISTADATFFGFLFMGAKSPWSGPEVEAMKSRRKLMKYFEFLYEKHWV